MMTPDFEFPDESFVFILPDRVIMVFYPCAELVLTVYFSSKQCLIRRAERENIRAMELGAEAAVTLHGDNGGGGNNLIIPAVISLTASLAYSLRTLNNETGNGI